MKTVEEIQAKIKELKGSVRQNESDFPMNYTDEEEHTLSMIGALTSNLAGRTMKAADDWVAGRVETLEV